jgi:hypothetical protein
MKFYSYAFNAVLQAEGGGVSRPAPLERLALSLFLRFKGPNVPGGVRLPVAEQHALRNWLDGY